MFVVLEQPTCTSIIGNLGCSVTQAQASAQLDWCDLEQHRDTGHGHYGRSVQWQSMKYMRKSSCNEQCPAVVTEKDWQTLRKSQLLYSNIDVLRNRSVHHFSKRTLGLCRFMLSMMREKDMVRAASMQR